MSENETKIRPALWEPIPGYEGVYEVSSEGEIRRLSGTDSIGRPRNGRVLRQCNSGRGYMVVSLSKNAVAENIPVHRIVAASFLGGIPAARVVNHKDGNKANNRAENLEVVTQAENEAHAKQFGLKAAGAQHGMYEYDDATRRAVAGDYLSSGRNKIHTAKRFGMSPRNVGRIIDDLAALALAENLLPPERT